MVLYRLVLFLEVLIMLILELVRRELVNLIFTEILKQKI